jgi:ubiquitin-conjugating enzyme E2 J2
MRLQRESKMAKKDYDTQIKKHGKIMDNFICLPDPENVHHWYFIIFGLEEPKEFKSGYYIGKITCPDEYPQKAPRIDMYTENGKFCTYPNFDHGICLSISHHHPESWNPVWKVNQIVIGLISFWLQTEHTWGDTQYDYKWPENSLNKNEQILAFAKDSVEHVKSHEKFHIFQDYADYIGINTREELKEWDEVISKRDTFLSEKATKDAEAKKQREIEKAEKERVQKIEKDK